jgi:hypothetical protein
MKKRNIKKWIRIVGCNVDDFKKKFWENVPGDEKLKYAWDMVVEAMHLKGTPEKLKFKKVIRVLKKDPSCPW